MRRVVWVDVEGAGPSCGVERAVDSEEGYESNRADAVCCAALVCFFSLKGYMTTSYKRPRGNNHGIGIETFSLLSSASTTFSSSVFRGPDAESTSTSLISSSNSSTRTNTIRRVRRLKMLCTEGKTWPSAASKSKALGSRHTFRRIEPARSSS
jgi:hypothetical protein